MAASSHPIWPRIASAVAVTAILVAAVCTTRPLSRQNASRESRDAKSTRRTLPTLRVTTLNIAHGRRDGVHQALLRKDAIRRNLDDIAQCLIRERPDVVALQEADGPSLWSGMFNHVEHVASGADLPYFFRGEHMAAMRLSYGTALLARTPWLSSRSVTFAPTPPTPSKGFVLGTTQWPGRPDIDIDVVSVHLDFSRESVRQSQIDQLCAAVASHQHPLIVMGDFNCEWSGEESLHRLCTELGVSPYAPSESMATFASSGRRLDWILISPELEFADYRVLPDNLSDHLAVCAELRLK